MRIVLFGLLFCRYPQKYIVNIYVIILIVKNMMYIPIISCVIIILSVSIVLKMVILL